MPTTKTASALSLHLYLVDACIEVTYTAPAGGAVLQAWIDFNGNGQLEAGEQVSFVGGGALAAGTNQVVNLCFTVPTDAVFNDGTAFVRQATVSAFVLLAIFLTSGL